MNRCVKCGRLIYSYKEEDYCKCCGYDKENKKREINKRK